MAKTERRQEKMAKINGKTEVWPGNIPNPKMPYAPAVKAGNWVFVAGQIASDFKTGLAPEARVNSNLPFNDDPLTLQSRYVMENIGKTLEAAGTSYDDVMRIFQWFPGPDDWELGTSWSGVNITRYLEERNKFILDKRPASTGMGIRELLVKDTILEVNLIA
ncbi:MAG TPA: RidA family protein, partial [Planctomycetaceae bacterium]|nr:RidA family protein [Planctomycetaceae bacterium]